MKKMIFVMAVSMFLFDAIVIAQQGTATITIVDVGGGYGEIRYSADVNISSFALDVTVSAGTITEITNYFVGECNSTNKGYGIFVGTIDIDDTGTVVSWGTPIAPVTDLPSDTKPGLDSNGVTIEMGALYTAGNRPLRTGTLCRLAVSSACNMTVTANMGRGMVVEENGSQAMLNLTGATNVPITAGECTMPNVDGMTLADANAAIRAAGCTGTITMTDHTADNTQTAHTINSQNPAASWTGPCDTAVTLTEAYNYPACWDDPRQCHGDYSNDGFVDTADWSQLRDGWLKSCPNPVYTANACADYNRDGIIDTADWPNIRDWWLKFPPADCIPGDLNGIFDPDDGCALFP